MSATTLKENKMGVMPVGKLLVNMALPMIISMLVQALYNVVDSIYISRISESAVTALSPGLSGAEYADRFCCGYRRWYQLSAEQITG